MMLLHTDRTRSEHALRLKYWKWLVGMRYWLEVWRSSTCPWERSRWLEPVSVRYEGGAEPRDRQFRPGLQLGGDVRVVGPDLMDDRTLDLMCEVVKEAWGARSVRTVAREGGGCRGWTVRVVLGRKKSREFSVRGWRGEALLLALEAREIEGVEKQTYQNDNARALQAGAAGGAR